MFRKMAVGSEIDSYCGRCKMLMNHIVVAMVDDLPRRVRCLTCQSEHNHRLPKAKAKKSSKTASKSKSKSKSASSSRNSASVLAKWQSLIADWDDTTAKKYSIYESFGVNDRVQHATFGKGIVTDVRGPDKIITLFESGEKLLMHGRQRP